MRTDFLPALFLAASAVISPAHARMTSQMVRRSIDLQERAAADAGHLHLLTAPKVKREHDSVHRRHHKKRACSAGSSNASSGSVSSSVSGNSTTSGSTKVKNNAKTSGTPSSSSSSKNSSGSSSSSSKSNSGSSGSSSSSSSSSSSDSSSDTSSDSSTSSSGTSSASGSVSGFSGTNTGIGSWFRTDSSQDSTNGRSWCQLNYQDSWMGFAPSVGTMLKSGDTATAGKLYCGREAKATNPNNGKSALIYIVDGFDDAWVKTPGSIDLTLAAFEALYGSSPNGNKNTVIMDLQWEFTGNVKEEYTFNSGS